MESHLASSSEPADAELVSALVARRPDAARVAWRRFLPLVMHILRRKLGPSDGADDMAQEVFAYFFGSIHRLRDPAALRAYVITVTNRTLWHELRRRRQRAHLNVDVQPQRLPAVGELADPFSRQAFSRLCHLVAGMNERDRRVLLMCMIERREADEVAESLGLSVPTIRRALARARKRVAIWGATDPFLREFAELGSLRRLAPAT